MLGLCTITTVFLLAFVAGGSFAQPEEPWYLADERVSSIHKDRRAVNLRLTSDLLRLLNPLDMTAFAVTVKRSSPVSLVLTRGPEIAPFLTSPMRPITKAGYADLCERAKPLLVHTDGLGLETMINELHAFEIHCQFVTPEDAERINAMLAGMVGIGRFEAARSSLPNTLVAVRYLSRHGKPVPYLTLNDELVLIDIRPYDPPLMPDLAEPEKSQARADRAAASLPRICAAALGEMYWRQMSGDQKSDFNARFWRSVASLPTTTQHPGRMLFTEAFVIAVLYPSTFETEPVGTFTIPGTRTPGPISGELLDRVRYVDVLLDQVEQDFLKTIPESAYLEPAPRDE